jgi:protein-disulfide isomerase
MVDGRRSKLRVPGYNRTRIKSLPSPVRLLEQRYPQPVAFAILSLEGPQVASGNRKASQKQFVFLLGVIAVLGAGALGYVATRPKGRTMAIDPNMPLGTAQSFLMGSADAPVQITEFADFECPLCSEWATITEPDVRERLIKPGLVAIRFYVWPLPMHKNTWAASNAAYCANEQGRFWPMHDRLFYTQDLWNGQATSNPDRNMKGYAKDLGLDQAKFAECYDSGRQLPNIKASAAEAERRGLGGTPTFIIGDKAIEDRISFDAMKKLVDEELAKRAKADTARKKAAK